jgi:hypothetical protein
VACSLLFGFLKILQDELVHLKSSLLDLGSGKDDKRMQRQDICSLIKIGFYISRTISLKSIIDRAEMDLKSKAEAVLSSTFSDSFTGIIFCVANLPLVFVQTHLVQCYRPSVASSLFYRGAHLLQQAEDAPAPSGTFLSQMRPPAFVRPI